MRNPDPMADNQTDQTIIALMNGSADDATRDHATAALLSSVQKLIVKTSDIEQNLWKPSDLEKVIDDRHKLVCQACPVRQFAAKAMTGGSTEAGKSESPMTMFFKDPLRIGLVLLCAGLLATVMILATGRDGFRDITDAAHLTQGDDYQHAPSQYPARNDWWKNGEKK